MTRRLSIAAVLLASLALAGLAHADTIQRGNVRVSFTGGLSPTRLPRTSPAPIKVSLNAGIASTDGKTPPQLQQITLAINRLGVLDTSGLPSCPIEAIQPATTSDALAACRNSLVGEGLFSAKVLLKGQAPFPSAGKVYAFYGNVDGRPAILAHVYGTTPAPTSFTLPFLIKRGKGTFGTVFEAALTQYTSEAGYVTGLSLNLGKTYTAHGQRHSFLSAACAAPKGISKAAFPLAQANFHFKGRNLGLTLSRSCSAAGA